MIYIDTNKVFYIEADETSIDKVGELWKLLNEHHIGCSKYFADFFKQNTFMKRKIKLSEKVSTGSIRIIMAKDSKTDALVGYCISTANENAGEIDSLFVLPKYRGYGIGDYFMKDAIAWLNSQGVKSKSIAVAYGNDDGIEFYHKYGFYERTVVLNEKTQNGGC